mgnify:CR=1 FL=1
MFNWDKFIAFVGEKNGRSYANGLRRIATFYHVDIDSEYESDQFASLLARMEHDKKLEWMKDAKAYVKKYIEYIPLLNL